MLLLVFFSDCRIYLFSSLAARVFNKLTRYLLVTRCSNLRKCVSDAVELGRDVVVYGVYAADHRAERTVLGDAEVVRGPVKARTFVVDVHHLNDH